MCVTIAALLLAIGADGYAADARPSLAQADASGAWPTACSRGEAACPEAIAQGCPVYGRFAPRPAQPHPVSTLASRAADRVVQGFGFSYYYSLIPYHGPVHYNYRHQFDYPWHASAGSRWENRLTIVGHPAK